MKDRRFPARRVALRRWLGWVVATCGVGSLAFHHWVEIVLRVAPDRGGDGLEWVVGAALLGVGGVLALPARRPPAEADLPGLNKVLMKPNS